MTEKTFDHLKHQLVAAFDVRDWDKGDTILRLARQKEQWEQQLALVIGKDKQEKDRPNGGGAVANEFRVCTLRVSYGCPKYSYLLVSRAVDDGVLQKGENMTIHIPLTGKSFKSHVYNKNKCVYANPELREFYEEAAINSG